MSEHPTSFSGLFPKKQEAAPVQEPVTGINLYELIRSAFHAGTKSDFKTLDICEKQVEQLINTTPPAAQRQWIGLTDEAIWSEYQTLWPFHPAEEPRLAKDIAKFARAIEAKLKEKNT